MAWDIGCNRPTLLQFYTPLDKSLQTEAMHLEITRVGDCRKKMYVDIMNSVRRNRQTFALGNFRHAYPRSYTAQCCRVRLWKVNVDPHVAA